MSGYRLYNPSPWTPVSCLCFCVRINGVGIALQVGRRYLYSQGASQWFCSNAQKMGILHDACGRPLYIWENPLNSRGCNGRCWSACRPPGRYPIRTTSPVVIPLYDLSWTCHKTKHNLQMFIVENDAMTQTLHCPCSDYLFSYLFLFDVPENLSRDE